MGQPITHFEIPHHRTPIRANSSRLFAEDPVTRLARRPRGASGADASGRLPVRDYLRERRRSPGES